MNIARVVFPRVDCDTFDLNSNYSEEIVELVNQGVGGVVLFGGNMRAVVRTVERLRDAAGDAPLLVAADCEFGLRMRFSEGTEFPDMWSWGSAADPELTRQAAAAIALEMKSIGIDWNFAPVLDVNTNPANPIVNVRAFGEDPALIAEHGVAYIRGMQDYGVIACGKHFPGHGDTAVDSHIGLPVLPFDRARLDAIEFVPFRSAIDAGVLSVMTSHLAVPNLDPSGDPATLSHAVVTGVLRNDLQFSGVAVTDALDMGAIVQQYGTEEAVVRGFLAGNDVLEIPDNPLRAIEGLRRAEREGRISPERILESRRRLDRLQAFRRGFTDETDRSLQGRWPDHSGLAATIAERGIRVQGSEQSLRVQKPVAALILHDERALRSAEHLRELLKENFGATVRSVEVGGALASTSFQEIHNALTGAETILLALMIRPRGGAGSISIGDEWEERVRSMNPNKTILMNFGNPYLLNDFFTACRIDAFSAAAPCVQAGVERLKSAPL